MISELINKDKSIQDLINYLFGKYRGKFRIKDHWEADNYAIGLADISEEHLTYISTLGLSKSGYYLALESSPDSNSELPYKPVGEFDNLNMNEVENLIVKHLKLLS